MQKTNEQVANKVADSSPSFPHLMNKDTTRPSCFSTAPARYIEDCQECHFKFECHTSYNEILFYGEQS